MKKNPESEKNNHVVVNRVGQTFLDATGEPSVTVYLSDGTSKVISLAEANERFLGTGHTVSPLFPERKSNHPF